MTDTQQQTTDAQAALIETAQMRIASQRLKLQQQQQQARKATRQPTA